MKIFRYCLLMLIPMLSACSGISDEQAAATVFIVAATEMGKTHQAEMPTASDTPLAAAPSSNTPPPPTFTPTMVVSSTAQDTPTIIYPTYTPLPFMASWKVSSIRFVNNTKEQVVFTLYGKEVIEVSFIKDKIINVKFDTYYFTAYIGKSGPYNGSIFINIVDRFTIFIDPGNIRIATP